MRINEALNAGFSRTHQNFGLVVADLVWKAVWLVVSVSLFLVLVFWMNSQIGALEVNGDLSSLQNPISAMVLAREFWARYASTFLSLLLAFVTLSAVTWLLFEAYFRAGLLSEANEPFTRRASRHFRTFFSFALFKQLAMAALGLLIGGIVFGKFLGAPLSGWPALWADSRLSIILGILICLTFWLVLTIFETVVRANAVELLGRELFALVGIIATLAVFEGLIVASIILSEWIMTSIASGPAGILFFFATIMASIFFLSVLHGYLIVTRYSAVAVLSRTSSVQSSAVIMGHVNEL